MKVVGVRELKNRLSQYLRAVRAGERVLITDRGEVVAELREPGSPGLEGDVNPALLELAKRGAVILGAPNRPDLYPRFAPIMPAGSVMRLLDEERGEH